MTHTLKELTAYIISTVCYRPVSGEKTKWESTAEVIMEVRKLVNSVPKDRTVLSSEAEGCISELNLQPKHGYRTKS
jgi:hypothetical protein